MIGRPPAKSRNISNSHAFSYFTGSAPPVSFNVAIALAISGLKYNLPAAALAPQGPTGTRQGAASRLCDFTHCSCAHSKFSWRATKGQNPEKVGNLSSL